MTTRRPTIKALSADVAGSEAGNGEHPLRNRCQRTADVRRRRPARGRSRALTRWRPDPGGGSHPARCGRPRERETPSRGIERDRRVQAPPAPIGGSGVPRAPGSGRWCRHRSDLHRLVSLDRAADRPQATQAVLVGNAGQERARLGVRRRPQHRLASSRLRADRVPVAPGQRSRARVVPRATEGRAVALGVPGSDRSTAGERDRSTQRRTGGNRPAGRLGTRCRRSWRGCWGCHRTATQGY